MDVVLLRDVTYPEEGTAHPYMGSVLLLKQL